MSWLLHHEVVDTGIIPNSWNIALGTPALAFSFGAVCERELDAPHETRRLPYFVETYRIVTLFYIDCRTPNFVSLDVFLIDLRCVLAKKLGGYTM